ncbi:MAG: 50S ribosomal protein L25 [Candidatus Eremiobacteraeota bacterium]|nr:50S ribosomal protein L25 [Candidatus Eremiobacteraeota bacterium]
MATKSNDVLTIETRSRAGTTAARAVRGTGRIPAILFGHGTPSTPVSLDAHAFEELLHSGRRHHLLTITVDGRGRDTALIRAVQRDPVTRRILHADLQRVGKSESIRTTVPIAVVGVAEGVRSMHGVLDVVTHLLEVNGPADRIPENLEVDVTGLGLRDHVTAGDVKLPKGFSLEVPPETIIVSVEPSRVAAEVEAAAAPETSAAEVPTVAETEQQPGAES